MNLPNPEKAFIAREKIDAYLLSAAHLVGRHKAVFFGSLGYAQDEWQILERDLREFAGREAQPTIETQYGKKYEVRGTITGPNGRTARIVTAWIVRNGEDFPRFITAHPED
jgi:hypothetical protein